MNRSIKSRGIPALVTILANLFVGTASANAGVPMLAVAWPLSWMAFFPIVGIEAELARRTLSLPWRKSLLGSLLANLASTVIGIPTTWGLLVLMELTVTGGGHSFGLGQVWTRLVAVTVQAPWLVPYDDDLYWMIPAALTFLVPFFGLASVFIERPVFRRITGCDKVSAKEWSWKANLTTYGICMVLVVAWLALELIAGPKS